MCVMWNEKRVLRIFAHLIFFVVRVSWCAGSLTRAVQVGIGEQSKKSCVCDSKLCVGSSADGTPRWYTERASLEGGSLVA